MIPSQVLHSVNISVTAFRVNVNPDLLKWARRRADLSVNNLRKKFPKYLEWENGETKPTFKQLENFAKKTYTPFGILLFSNPPNEPIPIPDFRTVRDEQIGNPSGNLLDTIYLCERRQDWYREYARVVGEDRCDFVGTESQHSKPEETAEKIRCYLGLDLEGQKNASSWSDAMRNLVDLVEEIGVLVMVSGVVGSNSHRRLNPDEFRGFVLEDSYAPLILINGTDSKAAQIFTLAHELTHLWLGESALSNERPDVLSSQSVERWCNQVAVELLMPRMEVMEEFRKFESLSEEVQRLAKCFKVSNLVVLRRLFDSGLVTTDEYWSSVEHELSKSQEVKRASGGNFYRTLTARTGKRFALALVSDTLEGNTLYLEAFRLLGISKTKTFLKLAEHLEIL